MRTFVLAVVMAVGAAAGVKAADEEADARTHWAYEGGWFARAKDGSWYEMNELTFRKFGKPVRFKEVRRTKEAVELRDEDRKVSVRLSADASEVKVSDDQAGASWESLYKGKWKTPVPAE